jgi:hypothetical protein
MTTKALERQVGPVFSPRACPWVVERPSSYAGAMVHTHGRNRIPETLAETNNIRARQAAGTVHVHPNGRLPRGGRSLTSFKSARELWAVAIKSGSSLGADAIVIAEMNSVAWPDLHADG